MLCSPEFVLKQDSLLFQKQSWMGKDWLTESCVARGPISLVIGFLLVAELVLHAGLGGSLPALLR